MFPARHSGFAVALACGASAVQAQVVCLPIDRVDVQYAPSISTADLQQLVGQFEGRCLGLAEFDEVLETITLAYVDRGLILSRAYLPEQDLTSRTLEIKVVEGTLSGIRINGEDRPAWSGVVFPGQVGKPVNIRDTEQGLDQIQAMPRWTANMAFTPSETAPGDSILDVTASTPKRSEFRLSSNNRGTEATGAWITALSANTTNLMGLNDTWNASVSKSVNPHAFALGDDGDTNRSASLDFMMPYGRWSIDYSYSFSDYELTIPGAIDLINTDGAVRSHALTIDYLLDRNETTKQTLGVSLVRAKNENFIQDVRVDASSRTLTGLKLSYGRSNPLWSGSFDGAVHVERGLRAFGGQNGDSLPDGAPEPQYLLAGFNVDYAQGLGETRQLTWTTTLSGQYSEDRLYGTQAFSVGGVSTVRGSRTSLTSGSSGIVWRNELDYRVTEDLSGFIQAASFYGAVDYGRIFGQDRLDIRSGHAVGGVFGVKLRNSTYNFDVSYQEILSSSGHIDAPAGTFLASFEIVF